MKFKLDGDMSKFDQPTMNDLQSAMIHEGITDKRDKWSHYTFNNFNVPRVTEILDASIGKKYLIKWALNLGKENYYDENKITLTAGTFIHEGIEYYLTNKCEKDMSEIYSYRVKELVNMGVQNFISWYQDRTAQGYTIKPVQIEYPVVTPYFGGTTDCIMSIGKGIETPHNYVIDFKSSKQINIDYFLQTYFYYWGLDWLRKYCDNTIPVIDGGLGIIRIDKFTPDTYEDMIVKFNDPNSKQFLQDLNYSFGSILNWYYNYINITYDYKINKAYIRNRNLED